MEQSRICFVTICTQSYAGMAEALKNSINSYASGVDFKVVYVDLDNNRINPFSPDDTFFAKDLISQDDSEWSYRTFRYDLVELCTSVKPAVIKYFLDRHYDYVIYLDPDISFFGNPLTIISELDGYDVMLTPHKLDDRCNDPLRGGIFNLGFIAVANTDTAEYFLDWWADKLNYLCSADPIRGYFTDQKWIDFAPVVVGDGKLKISRHPGMNVAPWNFDERKVIRNNAGYDVSVIHCGSEITAPLIFCHFSGFNYQSLCDHGLVNKSKNGPEASETINDLLIVYGKRLSAAQFTKYQCLKYLYANYSDGKAISYSDRRVFKRLESEGYVFHSPFSADGRFRKLITNAKIQTTNDVADPEKLKPENVRGSNMYEWLIDAIFRISITVFGYQRVSLLMRYLIRYGHIENRARWLGRGFNKLKVKSF